ncbi:hypothetical protein EHS25_005310 [Saitozyma podzolica]|uniref:CorA metal ion transporter n=1 Tax=Saitozyma podzolica TaxID=1890683 RepID=A0A427XZC2_9TREE|nr:hypothetical protein EHS25_005310 [Saitozyma podzolica]
MSSPSHTQGDHSPAEAQRPSLYSSHSSSFHARALAVSAAHRFTTPSHPSDRASNVPSTPLLPATSASPPNYESSGHTPAPMPMPMGSSIPPHTIAAAGAMGHSGTAAAAPTDTSGPDRAFGSSLSPPRIVPRALSPSYRRSSMDPSSPSPGAGLSPGPGAALSPSGTFSPRSPLPSRIRAFGSSAVPGSPTTPDLEAGRGPANCENGGNGGNGGNGNVHFDPSLPPGSTSPVFGSDSVSGASRRPSGAGAAGMNDPADKERERYHWVSPSAGGGTGDEPGVNVRSKRDEEAYSHLTAASQVTVVDFSANPDQDTSNIRCDFQGERLKEFLEGGYRPTDDEGKALGVRWIHVEGLNWEVIKTLTLHFGVNAVLSQVPEPQPPIYTDRAHSPSPLNVILETMGASHPRLVRASSVTPADHPSLHPLAVEDALRSSNSPRSKLDFYRSHLYLQILAQHMHPQDEVAISAAADAMSPGRAEDVLSGTTESPRTVVGDLPGRRGSGSGFGSESGTGMHWDHTGPGGIGIGLGGNRRRSSRANSRGGKAGGALARMRDVFGGSRKMMRLPEGVEGVFEPSMGGTRLQGGQSPSQKAAHRLTVDHLSAKYMVPVRRGIISVFLTRDGTLISLTKQPMPEVMNPIYERLEDEQSLLRRSGDVSMLAEALLDVTADLAIEIMQTFEAEILKLEASVLVDPQLETVRHLHVLSSQLIRLRRTLTPLLHVCYIIRDQDAQRSVAASAMAGGPRVGEKHGMSREGSWGGLAGDGNGIGNGDKYGYGHGDEKGTGTFGASHLGGGGLNVPSINLGPGVPGGGAQTPIPGDTSSLDSTSTVQPQPQPQPRLPPQAQAALAQLAALNGTSTPASLALSALGPAPGGQTAVGFFTPMTKVYIGDVIDHLEIIVSSLDQFVATCDHLTDYVFNVLSFQTNASMERLSIVTVVFLPLTFIASYFGMNFTTFDAIQGSVSYFWKVAIPCTVAFFIIFSFSYLRMAAQTIARRLARWRRTKEMEKGAAGRWGKIKRQAGQGDWDELELEQELESDADADADADAERDWERDWDWDWDRDPNRERQREPEL